MSNCNKTDFSGGSCCTPPGSNEMEIKCAQIRRAIEKLAKSTEAQFLIQNEKIAETCVYIKENLSNAIRTLLNDMNMSGELDDIITTTVLCQISAMETKFDSMIMPEDFGAVGDGETDDTKAIQDAIDHANSCSNNRKVFLLNKTYLISKSIVLNGCSLIGTTGNIYNVAGSVIKCKTKDFTAIKQGSTASKDIMFNISDILVKSAAIGFELNYVINSKFERLYADECNIGFKLGDSESVGSMFNEFNNLYTRNCEIGIESISAQYFNNNVFNNGYIQGNNYAMRLSVLGRLWCCQQCI